MWNDRQGAVRITLLQGSARLDKMEIEVTIPEGHVYDAVVPVPEPGPLYLFASSGLLVLWFWRKRDERT